MGWVKLDDGFLDHPKFLKVGPVAGYVAIAALAWSNRNLTDGFIPTEQVPRLANLACICDEDRSNANDYVDAYDLACALVEAGLWDLAESGYQIHDYHDHQQTAEAIKARRSKDRDRKSTGSPKDSARIPRGGSSDSKVQEVRSKNEKHPPSPPVGGDGGRVLRFDRKPVPDARLQLAEQILAEFNQQANTHYGAYTGNDKASESLKRIIGALTAHPAVDFDQAAAAIRWQLARPYWGDAAPKPGNVFGPNVFPGALESCGDSRKSDSTSDFIARMNRRNPPSPASTNGDTAA